MLAPEYSLNRGSFSRVGNVQVHEAILGPVHLGGTVPSVVDVLSIRPEHGVDQRQSPAVVDEAGVLLNVPARRVEDAAEQFGAGGLAV